MPLVRYEVRCEHSLADPELYRKAFVGGGDDSSRALLEGVAMAGLVGIIRQLGDLADFAAELFQGLHAEMKEVLGQSHRLKARVLRLEAELPIIEKALLSETNQTRYAYSKGSKWHSSLPYDPKSCTQGDLPRFLYRFYEECQPPPHLSLLDKFDTGGQGACLKKFTDPSFFKAAWTESELKRLEEEEWELDGLLQAAEDERRRRCNSKDDVAYIDVDSREQSSFSSHRVMLEDLHQQHPEQVPESSTNGNSQILSPPPPDPQAPLKISARDIETGSMCQRFQEERRAEDMFLVTESEEMKIHSVYTQDQGEMNRNSSTDRDRMGTLLNHSALKAHVESQGHAPIALEEQPKDELVIEPQKSPSIVILAKRPTPLDASERLPENSYSGRNAQENGSVNQGMGNGENAYVEIACKVVGTERKTDKLHENHTGLSIPQRIVDTVEDASEPAQATIPPQSMNENHLVLSTPSSPYTQLSSPYRESMEPQSWSGSASSSPRAISTFSTLNSPSESPASMSLGFLLPSSFTNGPSLQLESGLLGSPPYIPILCPSPTNSRPPSPPSMQDSPWQSPNASPSSLSAGKLQWGGLQAAPEAIWAHHNPVMRESSSIHSSNTENGGVSLGQSETQVCYFPVGTLGHLTQTVDVTK
ncbi:hypothetical protein CY35_16G067100 [Sphagnum magellanicum]|nr:hypothetical protein CY35_16G067100 [Sphagnum magellanicum]